MIYHSERGGVFFYILFAIVLLAALSFAISQGSRTSTGNLTTDKARANASGIIDYAGSVAGAVQKLKLRGCNDTQISFQNAATGATYTNASAPSNNTCHVFDAGGAKMNWLLPDQFNAAAIEITGGCNVDSLGTASSDLILVVENIDLQTCQFLNERSGLAAASATPITLPAACDYAAFNGTYPASGTITHTGSTGRSAGCVRGTGAADDFYQNTYHFFQVLIAR